MTLTDYDYELISAYLDGTLDPKPRADVETRLQSDAVFRESLTAAQQTHQLLKRLPTLKAPRDFTLTPAMLGTSAIADPRPDLRVIRPIQWLLPALSAAASLILVMLGVIQLTGTPITPQSNAPMVLGGAIGSNAITEVAMQSDMPEMALSETDTFALETAQDLRIMPADAAIGSLDDLIAPPMPTAIRDEAGNITDGEADSENQLSRLAASTASPDAGGGLLLPETTPDDGGIMPFSGQLTQAELEITPTLTLAADLPLEPTETAPSAESAPSVDPIVLIVGGLLLAILSVVLGLRARTAP